MPIETTVELLPITIEQTQPAAFGGMQVAPRFNLTPSQAWWDAFRAVIVEAKDASIGGANLRPDVDGLKYDVSVDPKHADWRHTHIKKYVAEANVRATKLNEEQVASEARLQEGIRLDRAAFEAAQRHMVGK
ncbi:MAG: hypothetical protein ACLQVI_22405 [Polyangiaceae bacterium]